MNLFMELLEMKTNLLAPRPPNPSFTAPKTCCIATLAPQAEDGKVGMGVGTGETWDHGIQV